MFPFVFLRYHLRVLMHCMSVSAVLIRSLNFCVLFIFSCNLQAFVKVKGFCFYQIIVLFMYLSCLTTTNKVVVVVALIREIFFNTLSGHVMFYLLYKHEWNTKPFHFNIVFWCEMRDLLWSHSNGDIFHFICGDRKFSRESSPGISLVFIS